MKVRARRGEESVKRWFFLFLCIFFATRADRVSGEYPSADCVRCHSEDGVESRLHISNEDFENSVHGTELGCEDCHTDGCNGYVSAQVQRDSCMYCHTGTGEPVEEE